LVFLRLRGNDDGRAVPSCYVWIRILGSWCSRLHWHRQVGLGVACCVLRVTADDPILTYMWWCDTFSYHTNGWDSSDAGVFTGGLRKPVVKLVGQKLPQNTVYPVQNIVHFSWYERIRFFIGFSEPWMNSLDLRDLVPFVTPQKVHGDED
jgi:hypothetical protein